MLTKKNTILSSIICVLFMLSTNDLSIADDDINNDINILGYQLQSEKAGANINCYNASINGGKGGGDESICQKYFNGKGVARCVAIESTFNSSENNPTYACNTDEKSFCHRDSDCSDVPGRPTCVIGVNGNTQLFFTQFSDDNEVDNSEYFGICSSVGGSSDKNAISSILCRVINLITGSAGKAVCVIVVSVVGVMFFLGKVQWSLLLSVSAGVAFVFGAKTIISVIVGGELIC